MSFLQTITKSKISCVPNKHVCPSCCAVQTVVKYKIVLRISFIIVTSLYCAHNVVVTSARLHAIHNVATSNGRKTLQQHGMMLDEVFLLITK